MLQTWISSSYGRLFLLDYGNDIQSQNNYVVLILPGFGEVTCDKECFMSKLARYLHECRYWVFQADIYGHGESTGNITDISLKKIADSVLCLTNYIKTVTNRAPIIVTRGILNAFINTDQTCRRFRQICLNPYFPDRQVCEMLLKLIREGGVCFTDLLEGYCTRINIKSPCRELIMILSELGIFHQNKFSKEWIEQVLSLEPVMPSSCQYIETSADKTSVTDWFCTNGYRMSDDFDTVSLKEDAMWQLNVFAYIVKLLNCEVEK